MKGLTIEEKAKRYDEAIDKLADVVEAGNIEQGLAEWLFPELKESEGDIVRNRIIGYLKQDIEEHPERARRINEMISCLKKQDEQKPTNKVELKFKVGDWVVFNNKHQSIYQVEKIEDGYYILRHTHGGTFRVCVLHDESLRLWTMQDAKDGNILNSIRVKATIIFKEWNSDGKHINAYCALQKGILIKQEMLWDRDFEPATKEQRDILFQKMDEAGYEWDAEKKELKKIEQNPSWSKEDENLFRCAIDAVKQESKVRTDGCLDEEVVEMVTNWLKALKDIAQPQPKQKWSEWDEAMLMNIIEDENCPLDSETMSWLKSLKERYTWRPSDEQMENLSRAVNGGSYRKSLLMELYQDLKKLREE